MKILTPLLRWEPNLGFMVRVGQDLDLDLDPDSPAYARCSEVEQRSDALNCSVS